jgi:hypothetical protein
MVDLSGGPDGPIEHGFSNSVFIIPGIIILGLSGKVNKSSYVYKYLITAVCLQKLFQLALPPPQVKKNRFSGECEPLLTGYVRGFK